MTIIQRSTVGPANPYDDGLPPASQVDGKQPAATTAFGDQQSLDTQDRRDTTVSDFCEAQELAARVSNAGATGEQIGPGLTLSVPPVRTMTRTGEARRLSLLLLDMLREQLVYAGDCRISCANGVSSATSATPLCAGTSPPASSRRIPLLLRPAEFTSRMLV